MTTASLEAILEQCRWALRDEVKAIREGGGQRTYLSDGRYIGQRPGHWVYSFTADSELRLADDMGDFGDAIDCKSVLEIRCQNIRTSEGKCDS